MNAPPNREVAIFNAALELPANQRRAYLLEACADDFALRLHVETLLRLHLEAGAFLESAAPSAQASEPSAELPAANICSAFAASGQPGNRIGRYKLLQQIGEGGCGVVYMAEQQEPVHRRVALKVIKLGMDTKQVVARFEAERQALALMDHPNIAKVFDAGATSTGRPYFVMELIRGIPITRYCDENKLSTVTRLRLFIQVCQAIQHAHQKGIIHRDIKPSNVLVADHDGVPVPRIIDFGVAKATTDRRLTDKTLFTSFDQFIGTSVYMAPEQARLSGLDIDTRCDIYSLGVLLYELLSGKTPFDARRLLEADLDEMRRIIREEEPPRPSARLQTLGVAEKTTLAAHRQSDPLKLVHLLSGDLDWIAMKALEKDRARRYETANELAMDVQRYLANEPVTARPRSKLYRLQKLVYRNKLVFLAATVTSAALVIGLGISTWQFLREQQARKSATVAEKSARDAFRRAEAAASEVKLVLSGADFSQAVHLVEEGNEIDALAYLSRSLALNPTNDAAITRLGTLLTYRSWMLPRSDIRQSGTMRCAQFSPDGKWVLTASDDGTARIWDAMTGQPRMTQPMTHGASIRWAQFSPDGMRVATASWDHTARVWDARTGQPMTGLLKHLDKVVFVQFSPDGKKVATASDDNTAQVWDAESGQPLIKLVHGEWVRSAEFSPDGQRVLTASKDGTARIWDANTGQPLLKPLSHAFPMLGAHFSLDGQRVVTAAEDGARVWDARTGQPVTPLLNQGGAVRWAQFSADGKRVATASDDDTARVWNAATGQPVTPILKHRGGVRSVEFSPNGEFVLTASFDGTARLWNSENGEPLIEPLNHGDWVRLARFSPDGTLVVSACDDGSAQVWGPRTGQPFSEPFRHAGGVVRAQFNFDGTRVVTASADGMARVWDAQTSRPITGPLKHGGPVRSAQFSPDGTRVVTASLDGTARVWDAGTGLPLTEEPMKHNGAVNWAEFSPDGTRVVTACQDRTARVWDVQNGQPLTPPLKHEGVVLWARFSPDSKFVVTTADDSCARLWDASSGRPLGQAMRHGGWVQSAQFNPDGTQLVTASEEGAARIWDTQKGRQVTPPLKHSGAVWSAQFSPDGKRVVTASEDWTARVWDAATGKSLTPPLQHSAPVKSAEFSPDGRRIVTASLDGSARVWDANTGLPLTEPLKHTLPVRYAQFSRDGQRVITASDDGTAVVWDVGPAGGPVPQWLLSIAKILCGQVLTKESVPEQLQEDRAGSLERIRARLDQAPANDPWVDWGRWFLAEPSTRTISPYSKVFVAEYIENRLKENTLESLAQAERAAEGRPQTEKRIQQARVALEHARPEE